MNVNQAYSILNSVAEQYQGKEFPAVVDATSFVAYGNTVLSSQTDVDNWVGVLVDRIGRTVLRTLDLDINYPNIMRDSFEFGAVLQKITVEPLTAETNTAWEVGDQNFTADQFKIDKPTVYQELFSGINTWRFCLTMPDNLLKTAFTSAQQFASFADALISAMSDSMTYSINNANRLCVNTAIANKINDGENVVHLLTEYGDNTLTAATALKNSGFLKFMGKRMRDMIKYMAEPGVAFNHAKRVRATKRDSLFVFMLTEAVSSYTTYLESDTFHNELVTLPNSNFQEVVAWQGAFPSDGDQQDPQPETLPSLSAAGTIDIKLDANTTVNEDYIVAAFFDREALGTTMYDIRVSTDRNNRDEYTNYTSRANVGYFYDESENGVVFILD